VTLLKYLKTIEHTHQLIHSLKDKYRFDHTKIKEVLYTSLPPELRKEYHKMLAEFLETEHEDNLDAIIDEIANHYHLGEVVGKAIPYLLRAGAIAKEKFANTESAGFYRRALVNIEKLGDKANPADSLSAIEGLGDVHFITGDYNGAVCCYSDALSRRENDIVKSAELYRKIGDAYV
jgi:predicted ATPase